MSREAATLRGVSAWAEMLCIADDPSHGLPREWSVEFGPNADSSPAILDWLLKLRFNAPGSAIVFQHTQSARDKSYYGTHERLDFRRIRAWKPLKPKRTNAEVEFVNVLKVQIDAMFEARLNRDIHAQFNWRRRVNNDLNLRQRRTYFRDCVFGNF